MLNVMEQILDEILIFCILNFKGVHVVHYLGKLRGAKGNPHVCAHCQAEPWLGRLLPSARFCYLETEIGLIRRSQSLANLFHWIDCVFFSMTQYNTDAHNTHAHSPL
jgi:hypothetical protein